MAKTPEVRSLSDNPSIPPQLKIEISRLKAEGWRVKKQRNDIVTLARPRRTNHILHLLLSVVTFGLWLPVWLLCVLAPTVGTHELQVDDFRTE